MNYKSIKSTIKNKENDWHKLTGELDFRVNNDYLFRALLQTDNNVLKELIASLFRWNVEDITSADIQNPIQLGASIDKKYYFLDIKVLLNETYLVNLEMQIVNERNWPDRSLCYLCRTFDQLNRGEGYTIAKPAYQIGFTDFSPFEDHLEFYGTYQLLNTKDQHKYTDKFSLSVVNLSCINLATEEDHASHLVEWAKMFKAKTWEELRMLAEKNPAIDEAVTKIYTLTQEDIIREQMEAEELYYLSIQKRDEALAKKDEALAKKDEELVRKDELIEKAQLEIDRLKSIIAANNIKVD